MDVSHDDVIKPIDVSEKCEESTEINSTETTKNDESKEKPERPTLLKTVQKSYNLLVNPKQKGNPLLKHITTVPWEFSEIIPDYEVGKSVCVLFLSLRYHNLNPDYIHARLKLLGKNYELRILLVQVDLKDPHHALKLLTRICILANLTLMLAWSPEEAGNIIEVYKMYENKPADKIMGREDGYPYQRLIVALTSIKVINKTDAMALITKFGTLKNIIKASEYELSQSPGLGPRKAAKLYEVLHKNFCK